MGASDLSDFQRKVIERIAASDESMPCTFGLHTGEGIELQVRLGETGGDAGPVAQLIAAQILYLEANSDHQAEEFLDLVEGFVEQHRADDTSFIASRDMDE